MRRIIHSPIAITALLLTSLFAHAQTQACAITQPANWSNNVRWDGPCHAGFADGSGVLKELNGSAVKRLFFGVMKHGELQSGVIDSDDGYIAGHFEHGSVTSDSDRQIVITAFDQAASAADEAAQRYETAGNQASAKFYRAKAKALREQMD